MGRPVEFYSCSVCDAVFPDCGEFDSCPGCSRLYCSEGCAREDGCGHEYPHTDAWIINSGDRCHFCQGKDAPDCDLVAWFCSNNGCTRQEAVRRMLREYDEDDDG